jgi:hypothetical protein
MSDRNFPPEMCEIISDWSRCRDDIHREFDKATTSEERGALLAIYTAMMNIVEKDLIAPEGLEAFQKARYQDYCLFLAKESRDGDNVNSELLEKATKREIDAGRMSPDHNLRELALIGTTFGMSTTAQLHANELKAQRPWWKRLIGQA